jgi:hypothetical protein
LLFTGAFPGAGGMAEDQAEGGMDVLARTFRPERGLEPRGGQGGLRPGGESGESGPPFLIVFNQRLRLRSRKLLIVFIL